MSAMLTWIRESVAIQGAAEIRRQWLESSSKKIVDSPNALSYIESIENTWIDSELYWDESPVQTFITKQNSPAQDAGFFFP